MIDQFGLRAYKPRMVRWNNVLRAGGVQGTTNISSDFPVLHAGALVIAERMIGKLTSEEWKPLIASSLLYQYGPIAGARSRRMLRQVVLGLFLIGSLVGAANYVFPPSWSATYFFGFFWIILLVILPLLVLELVYGIFSRGKRWESWLEADMKAAELVGREEFLNTLVKIDGLKENDVERLKRKGRSDRPSITRRIENLRSYGLPS